jgi:hypothetical protein
LNEGCRIPVALCSVDCGFNCRTGRAGKLVPAYTAPRAAVIPRGARPNCLNMTADASPYTPPAVGTWNKESGGRFAGINSPIAGATHDR